MRPAVAVDGARRRRDAGAGDGDPRRPVRGLGAVERRGDRGRVGDVGGAVEAVDLARHRAPRSASRSRIATRAPRRASARAVAAPRPEAPPLTTAGVSGPGRIRRAPGRRRCPRRRRCRWRRCRWLRSWRSSACSSVTRMRAPEAPIGWPSAQAPPWTFSRSCGAPVSAMKAIGTTAKASLTSQRSTSPTLQPRRCHELPRRRHRGGREAGRLLGVAGVAEDAGADRQARGRGRRPRASARARRRRRRSRRSWRRSPCRPCGTRASGSGSSPAGRSSAARPRRPRRRRCGS